MSLKTICFSGELLIASVIKAAKEAAGREGILNRASRSVLVSVTRSDGVELFRSDSSRSTEDEGGGGGVAFTNPWPFGVHSCSAIILIQG